MKTCSSHLGIQTSSKIIGMGLVVCLFCVLFLVQVADADNFAENAEPQVVLELPPVARSPDMLIPFQGSVSKSRRPAEETMDLLSLKTEKFQFLQLKLEELSSLMKPKQVGRDNSSILSSIQMPDVPEERQNLTNDFENNPQKNLSESMPAQAHVVPSQVVDNSVTSVLSVPREILPSEIQAEVQEQRIPDSREDSRQPALVLENVSVMESKDPLTKNLAVTQNLDSAAKSGAGQAQNRIRIVDLPADRAHDDSLTMGQSPSVAVSGPIERFSLANSLFGTGEYESCLTVLKEVDLSKMTREDLIWMTYLQACCQRRLDRIDEAKVLYRRVIAEPDGDWMKEQARWWLETLESKRKLSLDVERLQSSLTAWEGEVNALNAGTAGNSVK